VLTRAPGTAGAARTPLGLVGTVLTRAPGSAGAALSSLVPPGAS